MKITSENINTLPSFNKIRHCSTWDNGEGQELRMHRIHVYPAKFPSFLISKSLNYARDKNVSVNMIGDIFCGCGTTALEARKNQINFWGCDINPVATLIANVKSRTYNVVQLKVYYALIIKEYDEPGLKTPKNCISDQRIKFWFRLSQINRLYKLLRIIKTEVPAGEYQDFFLVAFSNILKGASKWLTKSIKPTIDKNKKVKDIKKLFSFQTKMMIKAVEEANQQLTAQSAQVQIQTSNFFNVDSATPFLDMLITSPPYVTSYEYADLHQLSTLWLGYVKDFRTLRNGTIGSVFHTTITGEDINRLNETGKNIYHALVKAKKSKAKSVAKYFIDIKYTIDKSYSIIKPGGLAVFVIGNTKLKGVYIDNAKYLTECMLQKGFSEIEINKRRISSKNLSPYRNKDGKFSNDKRKRKIYSYEFVIIAQKPNK